MDTRLEKMKRQGEIRTAMTVLSQEYKDLEGDLSSSGDAPEWARRAAERAFTEADRWHQGIGAFDIEKLAKIIEQEQLRSTLNDEPPCEHRWMISTPDSKWEACTVCNKRRRVS